MTPFSEVYTGICGVLLYSAALLLAVCQLAALVFSVQIVRSRKHILFAAIHVLTGTALLILLLYSNWEQVLLSEGGISALHSISVRMFAVPWGCYLLAELVFGVILMQQVRDLRRYRKTHLSPDDIKEALDWLPAAVCIADENGTVLLSNLAMNDLAQCITGKPLSDLRRLWETVAAQGEQQDAGYIVPAKDERYYLFTKAPLTLPQGDSQQNFVRCIASDMTEKYRLRQELSGKNKHLTEVQARMKAVAARERSLIAAREIMHARMSVHNQMGGVLLSAKYYLDHPENMDETRLLHMLEYNNAFFQAEPEQAPDAVSEAMQAAGRIGVTVSIAGAIPEHAAFRALLAQAIEQCAANTVRHAGGDRLNVRITEQETQFCVVFTNNGKPPTSPIKATGGLAMLAANVRQAGGELTIGSEPVFRLKFTAPKS